MEREPTIFVTAAEVSGDIHAARLIRALSARLEGPRFVGVGGRHMAEAGCELLGETTGRATMLLHSVAQVLYFRRLIGRVAEAMAQRRPAVHVPVDSPAMNWHLARAAHRRRIPVMYYICPQVWAWAPWRVRKLRRLTDAVACILPFEPEYLRPRGVNAHYVGHPLFDDLPRPDPPDLAQAARTGRWRIALLPGSRVTEINHHAPALAQVYDRLRRRYPQAEFTFTAFGAEAADRIRRKAGRDDLPMEVSRTPEVLRQCHFAVVASGTVTLEVAHFGVPMVVFYRASRLGYHLLGRWLIRTPY
ncbi:MAG: lipid-A-disaccharide synthase, partial [Planctomycetota bacterium]